ncbi:MAG: 2-oxo acid dehydrogenase subunit E2 [Planctomycetaceae bacterium]|nr:2-oxo acid dehydrogenase subunit E2 [Planctomycetaceae bacterium]
MSEFRMPSLGADMEAGLLVAWQKKPGDKVRRGETIAEVETDKGIIEIESFADGTLEKIVVPEGERVPVGTLLALIQTADEAATPTASAAPAVVPPASATPPPRGAPSPAVTGELVPTSSASTIPRRAVSPAARRKASELGVNVDQLPGTGPGGAVTLDDVQRAASAAPPPTAAPPPAPMTDAERAARMRQTIAAAMSRSKREIPHYYLSHTIDLEPALAWLARENERRAVTERLLYGVLLLKAVALALRETPELNAIWERDRAVTRPDIHVGTAIALRQGGLIAPALHHTDRKSLDELMAGFRDLVNRTRTGGLRSSELSDPTITVTSLGERGVEAVFGIIYPPQTAIVGFGKVVERPWSIGGQIVSRRVITASLSADHRVTDGHRGGLFLSAVERLLQEPDKL